MHNDTVTRVLREHPEAVLVGTYGIQSYCEKHGTPHKYFSRGTDYDILVGDHVEKHVDERIDFIHSTSILEYLHDNNLVVDHVADLNVAYTLKLSHIYYMNGVQFRKHVSDLMMLRGMGAQVIEDLYTIAHNDWNQKYGANKVSLNKKSRDFFTGKVDRFFEHDSIHEMLAYYDEPMFRKILVDGEEVLTSKVKFDNLTYKDKLITVWEEANVLTLERSIIPAATKPEESTLYTLYAKQLELLVTRYTTGWFPRFIAENWRECLHSPITGELINMLTANMSELREGAMWDKRYSTWWSELT